MAPWGSNPHQKDTAIGPFKGKGCTAPPRRSLAVRLCLACCPSPRHLRLCRLLVRHSGHSPPSPRIGRACVEPQKWNVPQGNRPLSRRSTSLFRSLTPVPPSTVLLIVVQTAAVSAVSCYMLHAMVSLLERTFGGSSKLPQVLSVAPQANRA